MTDSLNAQKHIPDKPGILIVDDQPVNIRILSELLKDDYHLQVATDGKKALEIAGGSKRPDLILLDIQMPGMDGYEVCRNLQSNERTAKIPVFFVTAMDADTDEKKGLSLGVADYIVRPFNPGIVRARIKNQIEKRRSEKKLMEYRIAVEQSTDGIAFADMDGIIRFANKAWAQMHGYFGDELGGKHISLFHTSEQMAKEVNPFQERVITSGSCQGEIGHVRRDGTIFPAHTTATLLTGEDGSLIGILSTVRDMSPEYRQRKELQEERDRLEHILSVTGTGIDIVDENYNLLYVDKGWQKIYGDYSGRKCHEYFRGYDRPCHQCGIPKALETGKTVITEVELPGEKNRVVEVHTNPFRDADGKWMVAEFNMDITERKESENIQEQLRAQLAQAQKMESVGRLAGGVAHDFNNMLNVILIHLEIAQEDFGPETSMYKRLEVIRQAAERSADLTRQLLAFARKQIVSPRVLDLNEAVSGMLKILRRLIGENIELIWKPGKDLWTVRMDPSQVDQILANLCVNARDAISDVGRIIIETENKIINEKYCSDNAGFVPGDYVLMTLSDDGCGMDQNVLEHLFEPFYTTKDFGKGTGLGLSTVYGAVMQNSGIIKVYSEPDHGTVFRIYLPRHDARRVIEPPLEKTEAACGNETILLVEDEPMILKMTENVLQELGYKVLSAASPVQAVKMAEEYGDTIDLLMTDVIMPEMNGRDLAKHMHSLHPDAGCLFMSGYTADLIAHHGVLNEGLNFIQKPFSVSDLATKLREVLEK